MSIEKYVKKYALNKFYCKEIKENFIAHFCPAIASANVGDAIIADAVSNELAELFPNSNIVTYPCKTPLHARSVYESNTAEFRFVGGTNILRGNKPQRTWAVNYLDLWKHKSVILLGAGWGKYQKKIDVSSKFFLKHLLDRNLLHSVRDSYAQEQLKRCGINNTIVTACPTTWKLTEQFCSLIPHEKKPSVVLTLTDYAKNPERDRFLLQCCSEHYENLFFFSQSHEDIPYFYAIVPENIKERFSLISPQLRAYDLFLEQEQPDFVGTRLHGGIRAMQHCCRALIIGIDNRAKEMAKDISLPLISQENLFFELSNTLKSGWSVALKIPVQNINIWKNQFSRKM